MKLTPKFFDAEKVAEQKGIMATNSVRDSQTCCGAYELTLLTTDDAYIAKAISNAINGFQPRDGQAAIGKNFILYYAPTLYGYRAVLDILKSFGFQSLGTFFNPNTSNTVEGVYFIKDKE